MKNLALVLNTRATNNLTDLLLETIFEQFANCRKWEIVVCFGRCCRCSCASLRPRTSLTSTVYRQSLACTLQEVDERELLSLRYGGVKITAFNVIDRDKAASYQRDITSRWRTLNVNSYTSFFTVCIIIHHHQSHLSSPLVHADAKKCLRPKTAIFQK